MARYTVTLTETAAYRVTVEADSRQAAVEAAEERFVQEEFTAFPVTVLEREATLVQDRDTGEELR